MDRLKDKVAIVTGSTSGIGIGIARLYAAEGAQVVVCGRRVEKGQAVVDSITAEGGKAGVDMLTQSVALQYGKDNVRCNCVRPGLIVTPENDAHVPQALKDIFMSNIMVNRYGCPEDIGHACVYFGSDESAYVSGQIITVDGGMNSHAPTVAQFRAMGSRTW